MTDKDWKKSWQIDGDFLNRECPYRGYNSVVFSDHYFNCSHRKNRLGFDRCLKANCPIRKPETKNVWIILIFDGWRFHPEGALYDSINEAKAVIEDRYSDADENDILINLVEIPSENWREYES